MSWACAPHPPAPSSPPVVDAEAVPAPAARPAKHARGLQAPEVQAQALQILADVARARDLPLTREVRVDVIDRPGIRAFAKESLYEESSPEEILMLGKIEASLGILPRDVDPESVLLDLLEEGVLGFYDPKRRTLFIGDFVPKPMLSMVVGHEIAHGLQDMHFDLVKHQEPMLHQADAESARRFLIEGEAQAAYLAWMSGEGGLKNITPSVWQAMGDQVLDFSGFSPYPILARALQMPYSDGTATVAQIVLDQGWPAVSELYKRLPETTEQMLHYEKLKARELAIPVALDAEALAQALGRSAIWHDQIGEATWLAMLAEVEGSRTARRCAAGWGGDVLLAFHEGTLQEGVPAVVTASTWDTEADARDFEACLRHYRDEVLGIEATVLERRGATIVFATQIPAGVAPQAVAKAAWAGLRVDGGRG